MIHQYADKKGPEDLVGISGQTAVIEGVYILYMIPALDMQEKNIIFV